MKKEQPDFRFLKSMGKKKPENFIQSIRAFTANVIDSICDLLPDLDAFDPKSWVDKGGTPAGTMHYMRWCRSICCTVVGKQVYQLDDHIDYISMDTPKQLERALIYLRLQIELFRHGYERLRRHPDRFEHLGPDLHEALFEETMNTWVDDFPIILSSHIKNLRSAGRTEEARVCELELQEVKSFLEELLHASVRSG